MVGQHRVSVVATVYNEASNIEEWLTALLDQTLTPDEIIVVDGGSFDGTVDIIERLASKTSVSVSVVEDAGVNISRGRNRAIEHASSRIIAVTDAGTIADPTWLECLVAPLLDREFDVASGFFVPRLDSRWERALAATTLPDASEINPDTFLPSSRSMAFRREWFDAGLRYPEWLDYCEDLVWDLAMVRAGARFAFVPGATVRFTVRQSLQAFVLQYARYARGDGKAGLFARRHLLRYLTYGTLVLVLFRRRPQEFLLAVASGAIYVTTPVRRLWRRDRTNGRPVTDSIRLIPLVVTLRAAGDIAKMLGYPAGLAWRVRRFGGLGWRTSWRRVSPAGELFRPAALTRGSQSPGASPGVESHAGSR